MGDLEFSPDALGGAYESAVVALRDDAEGSAVAAHISAVLCSTRSADGRVWSEELHRADAVLDAERIARPAPRLGAHVATVRIPDGMHDLALSGAAARERFYAETARWVGAYVR